MMASLRTAVGAAKIAAKYSTRILSDPRDARAFASHVLRSMTAYEDALALRRVPEQRLHEVFPGIDDKQICLRHRHEVWTLPYGEAFVLAAITAYLNPRRAFEMGTYTGAGTLAIAHHSAPDCRIFTLDLPSDQLHLPGLEDSPESAQAARIGVSFRGTAYGNRICQLYGDSATFDFAAFAGAIDLVFIDAVHTYEYVLNDTQRALEMLSPNGTIIWDDCSEEFPGVVRALSAFNQSIGIRRIVGTRLAVHTRGRLPDRVPLSSEMQWSPDGP